MVVVLSFILYHCVFQVVASLQAQLEQRKKDAEQKDMLLQSMSKEAEILKNQLVTVSAQCQSLTAQVVIRLLYSSCNCSDDFMAR